MRNILEIFIVGKHLNMVYSTTVQYESKGGDRVEAEMARGLKDSRNPNLLLRNSSLC